MKILSKQFFGMYHTFKQTWDRIHLREEEQDQRRNSEPTHPAYPPLQEMKNVQFNEKNYKQQYGLWRKKGWIHKILCPTNNGSVYKMKEKV